MLGDTQLKDLKDWLSKSTARVKFIVSSVPWRDWNGGNSQDSWKTYKKERSEIFKYITDNHINGIILLSGDQHWTSIYRLNAGPASTFSFYEFNATPLAADTITPKTNVSGGVVKFEKEIENVYGLFQIDTSKKPATIQFDVFDIKDKKSLYHLELNENDLVPTP
jgi:alkaline phosphatase D